MCSAVLPDSDTTQAPTVKNGCFDITEVFSDEYIRFTRSYRFRKVHQNETHWTNQPTPWTHFSGICNNPRTEPCHLAWADAHGASRLRVSFWNRPYPRWLRATLSTVFVSVQSRFKSFISTEINHDHATDFQPYLPTISLGRTPFPEFAWP